MPKYKEYTGETRNFSKSAGYKRRRRRKKLQKKVTSLVLSAALFGAVAGGTCYGINYGLETVKSSSTQTAQNQNTASRLCRRFPQQALWTQIISVFPTLQQRDFLP